MKENSAKRKMALVLIAVLLTSMIFISGCTEQNPVRSEEDVSRVVTNISTNVENVGSALEDIDRGLGGG
jgi:outer membrane lipoprotein-sorting protein